MKAPVGIIDAYLTSFARSLAVPPRRRPRVLAETEGHLRDIAETAMASGVPRSDAERRAIARFGEAEIAAAGFGSTVTGRAWRQVVRLRRPPASNPLPDSAETVNPVLTDMEPALVAMSDMCDVCGHVVGDDDRWVVEIAAVGHVESPVTLVMHPACYDIGAGIFALRGMPLTAAHPPAP